jgi:hypothetical protein
VKHLKQILWSSVLVAACLPAQAQDRFKVPFDFSAAGKHFSAGEYIVSKALDNSNTVWMIQNVADKEKGMVSTSSVQSPVASQKISMVFHSNEGQYSLYEFWPDEHLGRVTIPSRSKAENNRLAKSEIVQILATKGN